MIFQHTWEKVIMGQKTQTRRVVAPTHMGYFGKGSRSQIAPEDIHSSYGLTGVCAGGRFVYVVGKDYAVQAERGGHEIGRIRLTDIRYERRVMRISEDDARAEGFADSEEFFKTWRLMHGLNGIYLPVWALTFEVVNGVGRTESQPSSSH